MNLKIKLLSLLMLFTFSGISQINYENWSTLNVCGGVSDKFKVYMELEQRFNHTNKKIRYLHGDIGLVYKVGDKLSIGGYYRELYETKKGVRVSEIRPHLDIFYKFNKNWKVRIRNEYQIKEFDDDIYRLRIRGPYKLNKFENFNPLIQTEVFLTPNGLVRNRLNIATSIKVGDKLIIEPGYLLESNNKSGWTNIHILWVNTKIKF